MRPDAAAAEDDDPYLPLPPPPAVPVPQETFTMEAALQAWTQADYFAFVQSPSAIERARQHLLEPGCIRSEDGARAALRMAHELLNYSHRAMARCLYHQVAQYCCEQAPPSPRNQNRLLSALVQIAKMITVDARSGVATVEDRAAALAVLGWAGAVDAEARLWLEYVNNTRNSYEGGGGAAVTSADDEADEHDDEHGEEN